MRVVSRLEWGAQLPLGRPSLPLERTLGLAVHYSGTAADLGREGGAVMREHQAFHMRPESQGGRGWLDIAYNFEVDRRGRIFEGRGWGVRSAANGTADGNDLFYAACYQGADKAGRQDFTREAAVAFAELFAEYERRVRRAPVIRPHSDFYATSCPGNELRAWVALAPWEHAATPTWPLPLPAWWWRWNAWRLGEGAFSQYGPHNARQRYRTGAPRLIPPWAWARARAFDRARRRAVL